MRFYGSGRIICSTATFPSSASTEERDQHFFADLTVESGLRYGERHYDNKKSRRVELLYCECCATLFFGGKPSSFSATDSRVELLPNDPDIDQLPEHAKSVMVERRSAEEYALFMPTVDRFWPEEKELQPMRTLLGSGLRLVTIRLLRRFNTLSPIRSIEQTHIAGWFYYVPSGDFSTRKRGQSSSQSPGSALPFQCPACGTSYKYGKGKLSPIRSFRVGFAKTTQLYQYVDG
jgi:hypothetical protein